MCQSNEFKQMQATNKKKIDNGFSIATNSFENYNYSTRYYNSTRCFHRQLNSIWFIGTVLIFACILKRSHRNLWMISALDCRTSDSASLKKVWTFLQHLSVPCIVGWWFIDFGFIGIVCIAFHEVHCHDRLTT